nr:hypothetical protein [Tanacetum cinerariifolium]
MRKQRKSKSSEQQAAKKQKLDEEVEELKKHLQIVPNNEDDVYTEATPLALKEPESVKVVPLSQNYVSDSEEPEQAPLLPDYVPGPEYPDYLALSDEEVPIEHQPYAAADSPIALSSGYITDPDLEEDLEDESKNGPTDYPADGGDDDDNDDSLGDDADDEDEEEASKEDEEEEKHLALTDSTAAASLVLDPVSSAKETKPFETNESAATPPLTYRTTTVMSIQAQTSIPFSFEAEVDILLAIPAPPPSPLTPLSSPLPRIPSPPFLVPSPSTTSPTYTEAPLGYKAVGIRTSMVMIRAAAPSTYCIAPPSGAPPLLPIPLPTSSLPLPLPSTDRKADVPEVVLLPQKRLCIAIGPRYEVRESSSTAAARSTGGFIANYGFVSTLDTEIRHDLDREIYYRITDVWEDPNEIAKKIPAIDVAELG